MVLLIRSCILFIVFLFSGLNIAPKTIAQELVYNIPCEITKSDCKETSLEAIATNLTAIEGADVMMMTNHHDFTLSSSCFIQFYNGTNYVLRVKNTITFTGNDAPVGRAIFATSLHPCQIIKYNVSSENINSKRLGSIHSS